MFVRGLQLISLLLLGFSLTACGLFGIHKRQDDYLQAKTEPALKIPKGVTLTAGQQRYALPEVHNKYSNSPISELPPGSLAARKAGIDYGLPEQPQGPRYQLTQSANKFPVLLINEPYKKAWVSVGRALRTAHYEVVREDTYVHSYFVLTPAEQKRPVTEEPPLYRVLLTSSHNKTRVAVRDEFNKDVSSSVATDILKDIELQLPSKPTVQPSHYSASNFEK